MRAKLFCGPASRNEVVHVYQSNNSFRHGQHAAVTVYACINQKGSMLIEKDERVTHDQAKVTGGGVWIRNVSSMQKKSDMAAVHEDAKASQGPL